ncbi:hypothetical protein FACS18949_09980 [Clostridia bacterium]|nr:hypothetical protein FACS18949_09980 [Clostridia bacterium]
MATEQERRRAKKRAAILKAAAKKKAAQKKRGVIIAVTVFAAVAVVVAGIIIGVNVMGDSKDAGGNFNTTVPELAPERPGDPLVYIEMEDGGTIVVELYPDMAPNTVNNFVSLVKRGYYDGLIFHRVIPNFMIQGGDPQGTGMGGPGYGIAGEFSGNGFAQNTLSHTAGVISMARSQSPDSAGSQFFICNADAPHLDGQYAAFGKVLWGFETVERISAVKTDASDRPLTQQKMKTVTVKTFGAEFPEPVTNAE